MIRKGKKEDAQKIARIKIDNWRKTYANIFPDELLAKLQLNNEIKKYLDNLKNRNVIIYEKDEEPIAYCYYGNQKRSKLNEYGGEIFALYVKNECQERGVGTKLLQDAIRELSKENKKILLWCAKQNARAISFYKKNGFEIISEETENIGGKDVEKVALGINLEKPNKVIHNVNKKEKKMTKSNSKVATFYELKKSANYIENDENIAIYTNPNLIFLKDETRNWFKEIINQEKIKNIPQKFINYLIDKDVIEELNKRTTAKRPKIWTKGTDITPKKEECPKSPKTWTKRSVPFVQGFTKEELINLIWSRPNFAQVELTRNCNFRCKFCFENCDIGYKYEDKPPEMWKRVIDNLYDLGIKKIHFSGGENFLYPHFKEILKYSKEKGLINLINTNGSIDITDILKYSDEFVFSLHGYKEVNDKITGFDGSFERTINNIEKALDLGKNVSVNTVLIKENFENYKKLYTYLESKFDNLTYSPTMAIPCYTGKKFDSLSIPINKENMKKYLNYVKMIGKDKFVYKHGLYGLLGEEEKSMQMPVCAAGKSKLIIKYNGNVYPCNFFQTDEFLCGNVFEEDINEIWKNGKGFKKFRKYYLNNNLPEECMNCKKHNNCFSGCRAWTDSYIQKQTDVKKEGDVRCGIINAYAGT